MGIFGNAFVRSMTPTLNALRQPAPLVARNGGPGSVGDPAPNAMGQSIRAYHPTPADRARNALAAVLQRTGQLPGEARETAGNVVAFSPLGMADDLNSGALQTRRGLMQGNRGETLGGILAMALAGAPVPKPVKKYGNRIFDKAAALRDMIEQRGLKVGELATSTNRLGQHSAYFDVHGGQRIRVSDHDANPNFRVDEMNWFGGLEPEEVDAFVDKRKRLIAESEARYAERLAQANAAEQARREAFAEKQRQTDANNAMLEAAGLGHLVGTQRKDALRRLQGKR